MCEDLRELRDEAEGVRLWLKRSRASFRLEVLSWDSEPESWDCCEVMEKVSVVSVSSGSPYKALSQITDPSSHD